MTEKGERIGKAAKSGWIVEWDDLKKDIKKDIKTVQGFFKFNGPTKYVRQESLSRRRRKR